MRYSIIVAIDNNFALTNNFIENLFLTTDLKKDGELIVVLDGCNDIETIQYLNKISRNNTYVKIIYNESKLGYGRANNIGVDNSQGDILVFINSDVFPVNGSINKLVSYLESNLATVGAVQGLLIYPQNNLVQSTGHLFIDLQNTHIYQGSNIDNPVVQKCGSRQALTSAFYAIPKEIFVSHNKFDEYYYNAYEGFELTLKITCSGMKCMYYPDAAAYHITGSTRNSMNISEAQQSKYFIKKWGDQIVTDIDKYISPQLNSRHKKNIFSAVIISQLKGWERIIKNLEFNINGYIYHFHQGDVNLYELFPYAFLNYGGNYLFVVDSIANIAKNYNWINNRKDYFDIAIDSHGNVIALQELII